MSMRNGRDRRSENPLWADAIVERVFVVGTDQRITQGQRPLRLHRDRGNPPSDNIGYMAAPERFATRQIPLATRAPSVAQSDGSQFDSRSSLLVA